MRPEIAEVVESLRRTRRPDLRQLIHEARIESPAPDAWPEAVEPYRWFLGRIGDGITLTSAGWLPPAVVLETMQHLGWDADWIGKGNPEDITRPVAELREPVPGRRHGDATSAARPSLSGALRPRARATSISHIATPGCPMY